MQVLQSQNYVSSIEFGRCLLKPADIFKVKEQLTSWTVFKDEDQAALRLESVLQLDHVVILYFLKDKPFLNSIFNLIKLDCARFLNTFHSV